jgi:AraC-like DNA-binding protein
MRIDPNAASRLDIGASRNQMLFRPQPPLDLLIDFFWVSGAYRAQTPRERVIPTGTCTLVIHLGAHPVAIYADDRARIATEIGHGFVCGARTSPLIVGTSLGPTVGVRFKPGGTRPCLGVPAHEFVNKVVSLDALWGSAVLTLRERLADATAPVDRVRILTECLVERQSRAFELHPVLRQSLLAFDNPCLPSVAEVNRLTSLSPKRLIALFRDEIGLNPKAFWRVQRFRAALRDLECRSLRGAALAIEHGYCDQAHFLREFRALAGSSPREYLAARVITPDHVAVLGKNIQY